MHISFPAILGVSFPFRMQMDELVQNNYDIKRKNVRIVSGP